MRVAEGPVRIVGRYAVYHEIAAGGMATVHLGRQLGHPEMARTVAIKCLHPHFAKDREFVSMFLDEARLAARIQHPNVVPTIDVVATGGELFLVMEYVRGEALSKLVRLARKRKEPIPPRIAASIMCGFLLGLHAAHEATDEHGAPLGLIHRDVSPQNVLVGGDGVARVMDFGIAKAAGRLQVTMEGQVKGKLAYMPPEQVSGKPLTRVADVYASAVVMWETLTAERLFKGKTEVETLGKILREPVPRPSEAVEGVTDAFDDVLLRALSRDAGQRHPTALDLCLAIEGCMGVATEEEVGAWVERLAGPSLDAREMPVADVEGQALPTYDPSRAAHEASSTRGGTARFPIPAAARSPDSSQSFPVVGPLAVAEHVSAGPSAGAIVVVALCLAALGFGSFTLATRLGARPHARGAFHADAGLIAPGASSLR